MRLKKLEIIGFKSFADRTVLEFGEGVTAIVGPNGCGKSNIADAFRWVLGEQSAKSMRGDKMNDVIFAGTTKRQPLNFAEVTITLTDIGGALPVEYEEIAITRRLHRSGESLYLINNHPVRLKDVQDLFLDSGVGKHAFSIFEQGKIDQIIHYTPLERRAIFEEAAGILRFLQRKREALRKLNDVDGNLTRIKDIFLEVEKQITVLEQQAEQARIYKENKVQLENFEKTLIVLKWDHLQKRCGDAKKKKETLHQQASHASELLKALESKLSEARLVLKNSEQLLLTHHEELAKKRSDKTIKVREHHSYEERLKEALQKEQRWHQEIETVLEKRRLRHVEADSLQKQQQQLEGVLKQQEDSLHTQRETVRELETQLNELRTHQQKAQQERLKTLQAENHAESLLKQNCIRQENLLEKQNRLHERQRSLSAKAIELNHGIENKKLEQHKISQAIENQKTEFAALEHRLREMHEETTKLQKHRDQLQQEIAEVRARQKVLLRLRDEMAGFSAGSKRLLQEASNAKSVLHKRLHPIYELITPKKGAEAALAAALRSYSQTLVAETVQDLENALAFAKQQQLKDYSIVCLDTLSSENHTSIDGQKALLSLVTSQGQIANHFLNRVYIVDTIEQAQVLVKNHHDVIVWAKEGLFIDSRKVIFNVAAGENNAFLREAELKDIEIKNNSLEEQYQKCLSEVKTLQQQRGELEQERSVRDKAIRRDEMSLVEINFTLQRLTSEKEHAGSEEKHIQSDLKSTEDALTTIAITITELTQKQNTLKAQEAETQIEATTLQEKLNAGLTSLRKEKDSLQDMEMQCRKTMDEYKKAAHSLHILEIKDQESQQQEQRLNEEIHTSNQQQTQFKQKSEEAFAELQQIESLLTESTSSYNALEQTTNSQRNLISEMEKEWQQEQGQSKPIWDEIQRLEIQIAQLETTSQGLSEETQTRYTLSIDETRAAVLEVGITLPRSIENTEQKIRSLRQEIEKAGNVNMTAIEEFDKNKERHAFLNQQISDLEAAKAELLHIITQLDTESRKLFKETVETIRVNFQKNFQILFNGGEADLQLTESADILEAGIDIIAKPPGKQMRSIQLLSGGEKCMTAMALLFAIFEVKPAPFCILDEIDAPLDEANVDRFLNVVKQFVDRCQFITITHNKRTMTAANVLFGVSMEERGVSRLLSMAFAEKQPALTVA